MRYPVAIKGRTAVLLLAFLFVSITSCARKTDYPKAPAYLAHPSGQFPITASYALYHPYMTDQQMEWVKEAGFNNITKVLNQGDTDSLIRLAAKHDMTVLVASWDMRDTLNTKSWALRYGNNPTVWGFHAYDEPKAKIFDRMESLERQMRTYAPSKTQFFNLLPAVGPKDLEASDYRSYLDEFITRVNPPFLSIDIYPVKTRKTGEIYIEPILYKTMEEVRRVSEESGRPFWSYVLSNKHWSYPKPTRDYLRFSVFTALAYGAQGLTYYTYLMPDFDKGVGEYSYAPVDWNGNRTEVWYMVRDINKEVRNLEKVFLGAKVLDVAQTGSKIPDGTKRLDSLPAPFNSLQSQGEGVMVSHIKNGDKEYLMLVNRDVLRKQKVKLNLSRPVVQMFGNGTEKRVGSSTVTLTPGGYAVFRL